MEKVVYVKAKFRPIGEYRISHEPTGRFEKGLFGKQKEIFEEKKVWVTTGYSDCLIDGELLTDDINRAITKLNNEGYEIVSITPITSGSYRYQYDAGNITSSKRILHETEAVRGTSGYGFGYGFSYTESVIILARKK
ncbi:MAG: hypothetical protein MR673_08695 [Fusobacterium perfoetens]|uniref:hypothetical protein n=1 Tax=Fusobacterium perfoetens TaxID=852 RepID=UPI0023F3BB78|nr:hypothetical protein [Fusobacterium perfoetens]MCI6153186.1 hypothetical protein [Fusobacterium perfoetens]MDY3237116.1 hypothetical protein [Fusobacterium perfoetens]